MPMRFLPSTSFLPEQEAAVLLPELARVCRQLGVMSVRASVVDVKTLAYRAAWSITETGDIAPTSTDRSVDGAFPGAASAIASLADAEPEDTLVHRQSPRRWAFSWSLDSRSAVVAEVQYRERRDAVGDIDRVLVRLLCSASVRGHTLNEADTVPAVPELVWPQVDRRARQAPPVRLWLALGLMPPAALLQPPFGAGAAALAALLLAWHLFATRRQR